ncbi:NAD(P)-binding protein [Periconia macrospinosa]|uniref:NAD(P)-binding protein n=1 Tax=Periconia macrospinosa TaxID=97972 RepID=A0A2V1D4C6_9PLEO|nr:NAD(P)-binding protein [Periconia macrospinosa]
MCSRSFSPATEIPSLQGKVILVTGGNNGLGKQAILEYARHGPAEIWMASRNLDKANQAIQDIHAQIGGSVLPVIKPLQLDLNSLDSVQQAARKFLSEAQRLDILMLNAGIMASPPALTKDGYEVQFGTNHLGHALLAKLLLPILKSTAARDTSASVRVVVVSSDAHARAPKAGVVFDSLKTPAEGMGAMERYGQSKTASILWTRHMAEIHRDIKWASIHPGIVSTGLGAGAKDASLPVRVLLKVGRPLMMTVEKGAWNQLWASVSPEVKTGGYYEPVGVAGKTSEKASDMMLADKVAQWTDAELQRFMF